MTNETSSARRAPRLLLVEDDRDLADSLVELLEPQGFVVTTAARFSDAVAALSKEAADIALIDIRLGSQSGIDLIPELRAQRPNLVCLLMTAYASFESALDALRRGADDYLTKPFAPSELMQKLRSALDGREQRARLELHQRLSLVGEICAGLARDVNNRLQAALGETGSLEATLAKAPPDLDALRQHVRGIQETVDGIAKTCGAVLSFARGTGAQKGSDAASVVRGSEAVLRPLLPGGVLLALSVGDRPLPVDLDASRVEQLLLNLVLNARDAVGEQGSIGIDLRGVAGTVRLSVRDDGCGIPDEALPRLFDPYFSTKAVGKGAGLGLSIVYGMVTSLGGEIAVDSRLGAGSTFVVTLPLAKPRSVPAAPPATPIALAGRPLRLLVVDDVEIVLRVLERVLRSSGHVALCESSGEGALARLDAPGQPFDCLVTDMHLPGMSGLELAAQVRARRPGIPIVLLSGDVVQDPAVERLGEKFVLLQKPVANAALIAALETLCAGS